MFKNNKIKLFFILVLLQAGIVFSQTVTFTYAEGAAHYNFEAKEGSNGAAGGSAGGIMLVGSGMSNLIYSVQANFNGGGWFNINGTGAVGDADDGTLYGNGDFRPVIQNGVYQCQINFSHAELVDTPGWPGEVEGIAFQLRVLDQNGNSFPNSPSDRNFDLVKPTLTSITIVSDNSDTEWATTGDEIKITLTADNENLGSEDKWTATIGNPGLTANIAATADAKVWEVTATVANHSEGTAAFYILFYDEYENRSAAAVTHNTLDPAVVGTVTIDYTAPIVSATILSDDNADNTSLLATTGDVVTLTITAEDADGAAEFIQVPTITIAGETPTTKNPNVAATSFTATRTMEAGDAQGEVAFVISALKDKAGNTASNVIVTSDGDYVTFDSVVPALSIVKISSDNTINDAYARVGSEVTVEFTATGNEPLQTPVVTIDGEAATEAEDNNNYTWTATKTMDAEDNEQDIVFNINFMDLAGNSGVVVDQDDITDNSNVEFDNTDPVLDDPTLVSSNDDTDLATIDDVITISIGSNEPLYSMKDAAVAGQDVANQTTTDINKTDWEVGHTVSGAEADGYASYAYTAVDLAGNTTTVTSASSNIRIDNTAPTLNTIEIYSDNDNTDWAMIGNSVTVSLVANETLIGNPTITIGGRGGGDVAIANTPGDLRTYTGIHTMDGTDTEGAVTFTIAFQNAHGLDGTTIIDDGSGSTTTNSSSVTFDRQSPTLDEVTISTNNDNPAYAKEGSIITLAFTAANTENLFADPTVTILGNDADAVSGSGASWSATYTTVNGDAEGTVPFTINFKDYAGNVGTEVDAITDEDDVIFDKTAPNLNNGVTITSNNTNDPAGTLAKPEDVITLSVTADDDIQKPTITIAGNSADVTISPANDGESFYTATYEMQETDATTNAIAFTVDFLDLAGNEGDQVTELVNDADGGVSFDKQAPSFTIISIGSLDNDVSTATTDDDHTRAMSGDEITVSLTSDEILKTGLDPTVTIAGNTAVVTRTGIVGATNTFTATYTMSDDTDEDHHNSPIPINISNYFDPAGNEGDEETDTNDGSVVIFDMAKPVLGTVTIASSNTFSHWAAENDIITVTIVSDEDLQTPPSVSILGANPNFSVGINEKNWTVEKAVEGGHTQGVVDFTISYEDVVGNSGISITSVTEGKNVTVDHDVPLIATVTIESNNDNGEELAVPLNIITLTVITNENIQEPTITIATNPADVEEGDDAKNWTATYQMTANDADDDELDFSISFSDSAGNPGVTHTAITEGSNVAFSKTEPTLTDVAFVSDNSGFTAYANTESILTLSFNSAEQLIQSSIDIEINGDAVNPAKTLTHNGLIESWQATYDMGHPDADGTTDNNGAGYEIPFSIDYDAINGNSGETVETTSDGIRVTYDETTPVIDDLILTSSNANDPTLAKVGDILTLELVANEFLQQPTFWIAGETTITEEAGATDASWSGTYTMKNSDTEGDQAIQVDLMDYAGNSVATTTETSNGSAVRFDRTLPTLDVVTIVSDNAFSNQVATAGDILTLSIEASEDLKTAPMFTVGIGAAFAATPGADASEWSGTYIMQAGDTEGVVAFSISFEDLAGNPTENPVTETTNSSNITFDKTATDISNVVIDLVDASDTGTCSADCAIDNLTNDQTPEFEITGLATGGANSTTYAVGDSIFIYVDGVKTELEDGTKGGVAISDALTLVLSTLAHQELPYEIKVVSQDHAGNLSDFSSNLINNNGIEGIRIDTQVPATPGAPNLKTEDDSGFDIFDNITNVQQPTFFVYDGTTDRDSIRIFYNIGGEDVLAGGFRKPNNELFGWYKLPNALSGNDYTFSAIAVDSAGNISEQGPGLEVTIDITGSDQPNRPDLINSFDSGTDSTDNITNLSTFDFSVTGLTDGDSVKIRDSNSEVVAKDLIEGTSANLTVYAAVSSIYTSETIDIAGNLSLVSDGLGVTVDQTAPDVSLVRSYLSTTSDLGVLNNDNLTKDYTPDIEVQDLIVNDSALLYVDGVYSKSLKALFTTMTFTADSLSDNTHAISIKVKDIAGNLSDFASLTKNADSVDVTHEIRIDTQAPNMSPRGPDLLLEDDAGFSGTDDTTNITLPRFELLDLPSDSDLVRLYYDIGTGDVLSNETRLILTDTIQVGSALGGDTYSFTYTIEDSAGNVSDTSPALSIVVDVSRPSVPNAADLIDASDGGQSSTDNFTNLATPQLNVTGVDLGDLSSLYVTPFPANPGDTVLINTEFVSSDTVSFTAPTLTTGVYKFYPVTSDTAGNEREGADLEVTIDLEIPTATISFDGDSLVRYGDEETVATFQFSEIMDDATIPPTIDVDYPEGTLNDLTDQPLTNGGTIGGVTLSDSVWSYTIPLNTSGLEDIDGVIALTLNSSDLAGNIVPVENITGLDVLTVDNTTPVFSSFYVDTDTSINVLNKFGWTLSETIDSGSVVFEKISGPGDDVTAILEGIELEEGEHTPGTFADTNFALTEGTIYDIIYTSVDAAGNIGLDTVANVNYDTTGSSATLTFSPVFVSGDSTVTITATFNERILPTPTIFLDFAGEFNDTTSSMTIANNDSSIWTLTIQAPTPIEDQGYVDMSITAMDLATNTLDTTIITDSLYVDNTVPVATFSYINISNSSLDNVGIGGDTIRITVALNEPILVNNPTPVLNFTYGDSGDSVFNEIPISTDTAYTEFVYEIALLDSAYNDGPLNITLVAKDRSNTYVTNFVNNTSFLVDNTHPEGFTTGNITISNDYPSWFNHEQPFINALTDTVWFEVPIQTNAEDPTLLYGGYVKLQFFNRTRAADWVTVGTQDSIPQPGDLIFYRTINEIVAAMPVGSNLMEGDSLEIRASITDRHGNLTYGTASGTKLHYDTVAPVVGDIIGGNMFNDTPGDSNKLYSFDELSILWSEFIEDQSYFGAEIDGYFYGIFKVDTASTEEDWFSNLDTFLVELSWQEVGDHPDEALEDSYHLEHNGQYVGHVIGFDVAGNISETLLTDTLFRFNTPPTIEGLSDTVKLDEDIFWTDTLTLVDPDIHLSSGDSFTYQAITTRLLDGTIVDGVTIEAIVDPSNDTTAILAWTPTQDDTGAYEIQVIVIDSSELTGTFILPMFVIAVNDPPVVDMDSLKLYVGDSIQVYENCHTCIVMPGNNPIWEEDDTNTVWINLTRYIEDVDNDERTEITWQAVILDTTQLDEDFPLGRVIVGPGTPWSVHARLLREYLGFDLNPKGMKSPVISRSMANQINARNNMSDPLLSVKYITDQTDSLWAGFNSAPNYYGSDHRIIFTARDLEGLDSSGTVMVTVKPKNDAPIISEIPFTEVTENDSIYLKFGSFTTDVDDSELTFTVTATTNEDKISISPSIYMSSDSSDSVLFLPEKLWSQEAIIQVIATDNHEEDEKSDTATFILDVLRVPRPEIKVAVVQNNAFSNYLQVIVSDTVSKAKFISLEVQNEDIDLDTIAAFTWAGDFNFSTAGNYSIDVLAIADVGDTVVTELIALAAAREASRWFGRSVDGRFSVVGDPGAVSYDQSFIIVDSSLFADDFNDQASYVFGNEFFEFGKPIEVRIGSHRNDLAIYRRKNGVTWEELPSLSKEGEIFTFSEKTGYFKLGPKTIIVPEETNIHQNYPNPFNPLTTIMYDIGLMDGLSQNVSINIYNLLGQHVKTLIQDKDQVGQFTVQWNGQNEFGQPMSTGVYFVQLTTKTGIVKNKKMMLLK